MHYMPSEVIEATRAKDLADLAFGLPINDYPIHGQVSMPGAVGSYDYLAVSECRRCGKLNTTLAVNDRGALDPMSAGRGPECVEERCGDKVSTVCHGIYEIVDDAEQIDDNPTIGPADLEALASHVAALNEKLEELHFKYGDSFRIVTTARASDEGQPMIEVEVAQVIAKIGGAQKGVF